MTAIDPQAELDLEYYRMSNGDLAQHSSDELAEHFEVFGRKEGRPASPAALRENFLELVKQQPSVLEIGPFCNPCVRGPNVRYFDVLDEGGLNNRAREIGYPHTQAPHIDFVSPEADLGIVQQQFSAVVSSHCIEHQPDFIRHLMQVDRIPTDEGRYFIMIPDKRYCFDHFIAESTVAGIVEAFSEKRRKHRLGSVIEHRALTTHNDAGRHWRGDHADPGFAASIAARTHMALAEFERAAGGYIDVHAWQFTPHSFRINVSTLRELDLIAFEAERVYNTGVGRNEFTAILKKVVPHD
ncbi:MAG: hypothetical protein WC807_07110 [Hyphomicrobium sp.]|jgi:hypothetical protein